MEESLGQTVTIPVDKFNSKVDAARKKSDQLAGNELKLTKEYNIVGKHGGHGAIDPLLLALVAAIFGSVFLNFILSLT